MFLNGLIVGVHTTPDDFVSRLRNLRRRGLVGEFVSVYLHSVQNAVYVASDGGRVCRPLLVVQDGRAMLTPAHMSQLAMGLRTLYDLMREGIVEYIDVNEENNCLIALREEELMNDHTHLEIDPLTIMGVVSAYSISTPQLIAPEYVPVRTGKQAMGTVARINMSS